SKLTLDAVRVSDGRQVMIKKLLPSTDNSGDDGQKELKIVRHLSSPPLQSDRRNHSMPYLDSFPIPNVSDGTFLVSPLFVEWNKVPLETINQAIDFINQLLEGLAFLHENRIAHRDCTPPNIMMDWSSLVDEPFHPIYNAFSFDGEYRLDIRKRSQGNVRYYFIDFGLSTWFETQDTPTLVTGPEGREQTVPELHGGKPYDPFKVDVFILGAFLERDLVKEFHGLEFLEPLLRQMKSQTPHDRPTAAQAAQTFSTLARKVPPRNLSWPMTSRQSGIVDSVTFAFNGLMNRGLYAVHKMFRRSPGMM
ncbi:kinase-like protein, partial [Ceratobasidium sp. AG-I]